jgi:hypothetical protein
MSGNGVDGAEGDQVHPPRIQSRAILADDQRAVQLADGNTAECWLVPFEQSLFDELWS